jgi:hypothetical protein
MRRTVFASVAVVALGLVIGRISLASPGPSNSSNPLSVNLISRATAINNVVDVGPPGFSPGDLYVFSDQLFLQSEPNNQVGTVDGRCVLIDPAGFRFDCSVTTSFAGGGPLAPGEVMGAGTLTLVRGTTSTFAVVGGTGPYRIARGDASIDLGPFTGPHEVTINLILNP